MKAYWITRCHVHNPHEYDEYIKLAGPAINKHQFTPSTKTTWRFEEFEEYFKAS